MFIYVHLTQEESWCSVGKVIVTHTNSFLKQWEQEGMISLNKRITVTSLLCWLDAEDLTRDIIREEDQIKDNNSTPLINDLEISNIFKDKDNEKGNNVIDKFLNKVSWLLVLVGLVAQ